MRVQCVSVYKCAHVCGQRLVLGVFLGCSPPYILAQGLSELTYLAGLASQFALQLSCYCLQVLKLQASHRPSQHYCAFWRSELQSLRLHGQHSAISSAPPLFLKQSHHPHLAFVPKEDVWYDVK